MKIPKETFDDFFEAVDMAPKKEEFCSAATNIIYITTRCNLDCDYCYQKDQRQQLEDRGEQKDITPLEITQALERVNNNNKTNTPATIVVFGGEPLLRPDLVDFMFKEAKRIKEVNGFSFSLTTNGLYFLKEENALWIKDIMRKNKLSLEISWDGSGHFRRKTLDGKSSEDLVAKAIDILEKLEIPITIRYTVHKSNYPNVVYDMIYFLERWKNVNKIQVSYSYSDMGREPKTIENEFKHFYIAIFEQYKIPICLEVCDVCQMCVKTDKANYFIPDTETLQQDKNKKGELQANVFNHWI